MYSEMTIKGHTGRKGLKEPSAGAILNNQNSMKVIGYQYQITIHTIAAFRGKSIIGMRSALGD